MILKDRSLMEQTGTKTFEQFTQSLQKKHCYKTSNKIYHIAIIDYLQEWNFSKRVERFYKINV